MYKRQNIPEEVIGDIFGVSQSVVSNVITMLTPLIADATEEFRPGTEEAMQATRGRLALVDGTLWPCWSWEPARELWAGNTARPAVAGSLSAMNTATLSS
jgi:Helix-turn-helix of DDE superfamily endonuclease